MFFVQFDFISLNVSGDAVIPKRTTKYTTGLKIFHRNHFSSALKRMSVVAGYMQPAATDTLFIAAAKGAPEVLKPMVITFLTSHLIDMFVFLCNVSIGNGQKIKKYKVSWLGDTVSNFCRTNRVPQENLM